MNALNARGHFHEIKECVVWKERCTEVRKMLEGYGNVREDIDTAIDLMGCIEILNEQVLDSDVSLRFNPENHPYDIIAEYIGCGNINKMDAFGVFVTSIAEKVECDVGNLQVLPNSEKGITFAEYMLAIAMHEVRHRLQSRRLVRMFTYASAEFCEDRSLSSLINRTFIAFSTKKREYESEGKSKEFIRYRINDLEFDAQIVVSYVISKLQEGITRKEMTTLIRLEL